MTIYFSINSIPEIKNISNMDRRNFKNKIFKEINFIGRTIFGIVISVIIGITASIFVVKNEYNFIPVEIVFYSVSIAIIYFNYLYILNVMVVSKIKQIRENK